MPQKAPGHFLQLKQISEVLFPQHLQTAIQQMNLNVHFFALLLKWLFLLHNRLEKRAFGEFAGAGEL